MTSTPNLEDSIRQFLHYDDPQTPPPDTEAIIRRGRATRQRHLAMYLALICVLLATSTVVALKIRANGEPFIATPGDSGLAAIMAQPLVREHPPSGQVVIVDESLPGWASAAWVSTDNEFCSGTIATTGPKVTTMTCGTFDRRAATGVTLELPVFQSLPAPQDNQGKALAIGLVRGDAVSIAVTFRNHSVVADVRPIGDDAVPRLGVYAVWLPVDGATSFSSREITTMVAKDAHGHVVARFP